MTDAPRRFRKKPIVIEATQWFKNGDHPDDAAWEMFDYPNGQRPQVIREGRVVRYFRRPEPEYGGQVLCPECGVRLHEHGFIDTKEGGHRVCPGDWIITGVQGERYPCKPDIFAMTYEPAGETLAGAADPAVNAGNVAQPERGSQRALGGEPHGLPGEPSETAKMEAFRVRYRRNSNSNVDRDVEKLDQLGRELRAAYAVDRASGAATHGEREALTRVEVIDHRVGGSHHGRAFVAWDAKVELNYQDEGRTLKIFVGDHRPAPDADPGRSP